MTRAYNYTKEGCEPAGREKKTKKQPTLSAASLIGSRPVAVSAGASSPTRDSGAPSQEYLCFIFRKRKAAQFTRQFAWAAALMIFMSLSRLAEIDEEQSESDIACKGSL